MDGLKFNCFIYFTVAMGLLGNLSSSSGANAQDDALPITTPSADLNTTSRVTNIIPVTVTASPGSRSLTQTLSGPVAVKPTLPSSETPKSKTRPTESVTKEDGIGEFLIPMGGLLLLCVLLLISTMALACKVCYLKKRLRSKYRPSADGSSHNQNGVVGQGETEAGIMLEEIKLVKDEEEAAEPDGTQEEGGTAENSGKENACHTKELDGDPATLEPPPAASAEPNKSPGPQTTAAPTLEPIPDKA